MTEWIVVRNWEKFQHYRNDKPRWIKLYRDLLHDVEFTRLTFSQRGLLEGLWLLYAETGGEVPRDTRWLSRELHGHITGAMLDSLNHAGFIMFNSRPETEGERDKDKQASQLASKSMFKAPETALLRRVV